MNTIVRDCDICDYYSSISGCTLCCDTNTKSCKYFYSSSLEKLNEQWEDDANENDE